jgi:sugar-specific transcriptional regulator TrmB
MSEESKDGNAELDQSDNVDGQESQQESSNAGDKSVKYETYSRVLGKLKKTESEFNSLSERLRQLEQEKLAAEGNKEKLIESLKSEVNETKKKYQTTVGAFAISQAKNVLIDEAVKQGCNSVDVLTKFLEDDLVNLDFQEDGFTPDRAQVKMLVENARKKAPILFAKGAPNIADHKLGGKAPVGDKKSILKMNDNELDELWNKTFKR